MGRLSRPGVGGGGGGEMVVAGRGGGVDITGAEASILWNT